MRPQQKTQKESNGNSNWTAESCNRENKVCCSFAGEILLLSSSLLTSTSVAPPRKALQSMLALEPNIRQQVNKIHFGPLAVIQVTSDRPP